VPPLAYSIEAQAAPFWEHNIRMSPFFSLEDLWVDQ
jgi:hypothetical protein